MRKRRPHKQSTKEKISKALKGKKRQSRQLSYEAKRARAKEVGQRVGSAVDITALGLGAVGLGTALGTNKGRQIIGTGLAKASEKVGVVAGFAGAGYKVGTYKGAGTYAYNKAERVINASKQATVSRGEELNEEAFRLLDPVKKFVAENEDAAKAVDFLKVRGEAVIDTGRAVRSGYQEPTSKIVAERAAGAGRQSARALYRAREDTKKMRSYLSTRAAADRAKAKTFGDGIKKIKARAKADTERLRKLTTGRSKESLNYVREDFWLEFNQRRADNLMEFSKKKKRKPMSASTKKKISESLKERYEETGGRPVVPESWSKRYKNLSQGLNSNASAISKLVATYDRRRVVQQDLGRRELRRTISALTPLANVGVRSTFGTRSSSTNKNLMNPTYANAFYNISLAKAKNAGLKRSDLK